MKATVIEIVPSTAAIAADLESARKRWGRFVVAIVAIGLVWLAVLPSVGSQHIVSEHIKFQQSLGIDPSAMFYSELEIVPGIAHRIERLQETHTMSWHKASVDLDDSARGK